MREVVIVSGVRTPVGTFGGGLKTTPVVSLGATVLREALRLVNLRPVVDEAFTRFEPDSQKGIGMIELEKRGYDYKQEFHPVQVDEVIMGNVVGAGQGQNVTRQAMIKAGISKETSAFTVNKVCASGMKAVALAAQSIAAGSADVMLAGGMENMSLIPYVLPAARWGARMNNTNLVDIMVYDGLFEIFYGYHMGLTAENIAAKYGITRQEQDELGAMSHRRAMAAIKDGTFKKEIVPVLIPQRKGEPVVFDTDERPMETSVEKMAKLAPAFKKDGTVTAGNASGINDAAAALLLMSADKAKELGLKPLARIKAFASAGTDPAYMGLGPIPAVRKILAKEKLTIGDFGVVELNEAFAVQAIACMRELKCDPEKTNVHGSGISIGHPIGCSGARILVTLMKEMSRRQTPLGLASLCIGGGQGMAMVLELA
ncbi:MAG: acetyl-CoA C-acyltransferase [Deltaproteobacteria bacterium CG_4_8_14_3_um_filter_51_11]|nr:acetyl-CoA C-acetyltransferase [bacterium]OIP40020.1 MAG: acetyl-CoA acetyltransferase [Desulfobacteraceae bacterium CG2_30_51_40]PIP45123.1 MAG: acetyl-CoA C-acyltransferase [Deltaproteobacteria bacterium CG23_combo_of_CG06-09_8_20_14_all_51_20]PIX19409.1 MAG: acetyl-CoA C-acyltransferase [Deltaproteobacteria bacterium CG_4_8_14_3_um_filter_51_11]PIY24877.1 MAG: acetyl-CoA C-acyltransferase [Deltaproteobacteria bacterium CG_4_10_14_3_um_filter_51_14]PJB33417.1 MAG: acetyl-CoA C-acyltransfe